MNAPPADAAPLRGRTVAGRIHFWPGGSLWIGEGSGRAKRHAHHAHQLAIARRGGFRFRSGAGGDWIDYAGALVPSRCVHEFEAADAQMAHLFVEPESRVGRALSARYGADAIAALPGPVAADAAAALYAAAEAPGGAATLVPLAQRVIEQLAGTPPVPPRALDPRLERALGFVRANLREPLALAEVADAVGLSPSRFRHLFVAQTGSPFRAYLLWLRINLAIESVMAGASWTEAAHAAGFADSAHLSRTYRRMFGIEPTAIGPRVQAAKAAA